MSNIFPFLTFITGVLLGFAAAFYLAGRSKRDSEKELERITESMKGAFAELSISSLSKNTDEFLKLAGEVMESRTTANAKELDSKKALIDTQLAGMKAELDRVHLLMNSMEKEREARFGEIVQQIKNSSYQTEKLSMVAADLSRALSSTAERGRWGERMALDIIRATGMKEKINYDTQKTMVNGSRPDFTFYLPKGYCLNMDVKFPLDSYLKYCSEEGDRDTHLKNFLKDVKQKIREVKDRGYIDQQENTLDVMLLFIPNESVYEFINEKEPGIMDIALGSNVVLTSPLSLFAVLAVIRQSVENFAFESTSGEMLKLFGLFYKQWGAFTDKMDTVGKRLGDAQKAYDELTTTRRNMLERQLNKIDVLRNEKGIEIDNG